MKISDAIKKIGRFFILLKQGERGTVFNSILFVDDGCVLIRQLRLSLEDIMRYFPEAEMTVLISRQRRDELGEGLFGVKFIEVSERVRPKRYAIALQMLIMKQKQYNFIVLLSLDTLPLIIGLIFFSQNIALYNQWGQWWSLRLKNVTQVFENAYIGERMRFNLKSFVKNIGLFFVSVQRKDEELFRRSALIIDNGSASCHQISCAIDKIKNCIPWADISILGLSERKELNKDYPDVKFVMPHKAVFKRYSIAGHIFRSRRIGYNYLVLLSLDTTPIAASLLFTKSKVILFNQWGQWWSVRLKPFREYLVLIPKLFLDIVIFIYLLISVFFIFLKRFINGGRK